MLCNATTSGHLSTTNQSKSKSFSSSLFVIELSNVAKVQFPLYSHENDIFIVDTR